MEGHVIEIARPENSTNKFTVEGPFPVRNQYGFYIKDVLGVQHGLILGFLTKDKNKVKFEVSNARNQKHGMQEHARGIVSDAIAQLVVNGIINQWYSSATRSDLAEHMYRDKLSADKRLHVFSPDESNGFRYLVTAKDSSK